MKNIYGFTTRLGELLCDVPHPHSLRLLQEHRQLDSSFPSCLLVEELFERKAGNIRHQFCPPMERHIHLFKRVIVDFINLTQELLSLWPAINRLYPLTASFLSYNICLVPIHFLELFSVLFAVFQLFRYEVFDINDRMSTPS